MRWGVAVLIGAAACLALWLSWDSAGHQAAEARARRAEQQVSIWQAKYAASEMEHRKRDTLYVQARARVDTLRDSLRITDTVAVVRYLAATDSALSACDALRRSCLVLSEAADSTIRLSRAATDWYKAESEYYKRHARTYKIATAILGGIIVWKAVW